jgi:RNA polymerase sigma factor (sigma-70 family)
MPEPESTLKPELHTDLLYHLRLVVNERNKQSFEFLFDHFAPLIRAYSFSKDKGASMLADDLVQAVMIKIWEKSHTFNPEKSNIKTWVFTLARNARIDNFRKNGKHRSDIDPEFIYLEETDEQSNPVEQLNSFRLKSNVHVALNLLPIEQKEILSKVYMEGSTHQEISDQLSIPLGTVKSRIRLALQKMGLRLESRELSLNYV